MRMPVEVETQDIRLGFDIVGKDDSLRSGTYVEVAGGARVAFHGPSKIEHLIFPPSYSLSWMRP